MRMLVMAAALPDDLPPDLPEEVSNEEAHIRGSLGKPPHEIRKPVVAIGDINADAVTVPHQPLLQIDSHAVQHLKLEVVFRDFIFRRTPDCRSNHARIMRRY